MKHASPTTQIMQRVLTTVGSHGGHNGDNSIDIVHIAYQKQHQQEKERERGKEIDSKKKHMIIEHLTIF